MTIDYRRSVMGSYENLGRKYLSDSLTPWYGTWAGVTIEYDDLPVGDALGRLEFTAAAATESVILTFNNVENLINKNIVFYAKADRVNGRLRMFMGEASFVFPTNIAPMWAAGNSPTVWTRYTVNLSNTTGTPPTDRISRQVAIARVEAITLYFTALAIGEVMSISGFNIRRL